MNAATETKITRNYIKHNYEPGLSKEEKAKQRRALRASLKAAATTPAPVEPTVEITPEPVIEPTATEPTEQAEQSEQIQATVENLKQALNRRDKKSKHKTAK